MSKYKLVLLDFDGTLADTDPVIYETMNILYDKYRGGRRTSLEDMKSFSGPPIRETLLKEFPNTDIDMLVKDFIDISFEKYKTSMIPYPGLVDTLKTLKEHGYILGVASCKQHKGIIVASEAINIQEYFDIIVGLDDVKKGKPSPDCIYKGMELASITDKSQVIYVGDNYNDLLTCQNAGVKSVIVSFTPRFDPNWKPDYVINSLPELLEVLENE